MSIPISTFYTSPNCGTPCFNSVHLTGINRKNSQSNDRLLETKLTTVSQRHVDLIFHIPVHRIPVFLTGRYLVKEVQTEMNRRWQYHCDTNQQRTVNLLLFFSTCIASTTDVMSQSATAHCYGHRTQHLQSEFPVAIMWMYIHTYACTSEGIRKHFTIALLWKYCWSLG